MSKAAQRASAFIAALLIFAADRYTKHLVETQIADDNSRVIIPGFFNIVHSQNQGIAFGIFQDGAFHSQSAILIAVSLLVIGALAAMLWRNPAVSGVVFIFGGALGNVYDRLHAGHVTDFLDFYAGSYHWYTFNLADASIFAGACLLILGVLF